MAALPGFTNIHPLQPEWSVYGACKAMEMLEHDLGEITGMDRITLQPAAGAQGEFTGLLLIKSYHESRGENQRKEIIIPDSAHGTNPASAAMSRPPATLPGPVANGGILALSPLVQLRHR